LLMKKAFFHFRVGQGGKLKLELHALSFRIDRQSR
jgi:hypothetical protein